jgi:hypothetical protein
MKTIRELFKDLNVEETVNSYGHKVKVQGRWARLQIRKQAEKVEDILEVPQNEIKKLTTDLQHDVAALKRFYHSQKKEVSKLTKTLKRNKDRFIEKSKVFSAFAGQETSARKEKVVTDSEVA